MPMGPARRNLAALARAEEFGGGALLDRARGEFTVRGGGATYTLEAWGVDGLLVVSCEPCPTSLREQEPGVLACYHRAVVARQLKQEGLVYFDQGRWHVEDSAELLAGAATLEAEIAAFRALTPREQALDRYHQDLSPAEGDL